MRKLSYLVCKELLALAVNGAIHYSVSYLQSDSGGFTWGLNSFVVFIY